jgi:outer membrane protein
VLVRILTITVLLSFVWACPAFGSEEAPNELTAVSVLNLVLDRSFGVKQAKLRRDEVAEGVPTAKSVFDTNLDLSASHQIDKAANLSPIFGTRTDDTNWNLSLTREIPTGTVLGLSFDNARTKTTGANVGGAQLIPPNALYEPQLGFSLTQPLMQNYFGMADRGGVKEAQFAYAAADSLMRRSIDEHISGTLFHYWNLIFTRQHIKAQRDSMNFAKTFLSTTLKERKLGIAEDTDVVAAKANLLTRETELYALIEMERSAGELLRRDLEFDPIVELNSKETHPPLVGTPPVDDARIAKALTRRGDYQAALQELERMKVKLSVAKNKRWPNLDIYSTLVLNDIEGGYGRALDGMDNPNWTVGMAFSVPLENRAARAGARRTKAEKARAIYHLKDIENKVLNEVTVSAAEVNARRGIVTTADRALKLQRQKLGMEMAKYRQGRSSSEVLVQYQNDVVRADRYLVEAWTSYMQSELNLRLSEANFIPTSEYETPVEIIGSK